MPSEAYTRPAPDDGKLCASLLNVGNVDSHGEPERCVAQSQIQAVLAPCSQETARSEGRFISSASNLRFLTWTTPLPRGPKTLAHPRVEALLAFTATSLNRFTFFRWTSHHIEAIMAYRTAPGH